jgi:uncharacterized membrane protein YkvA (DUF1232 family)
MSDINDKCLDVFPSWLATFNQDVSTVLGALKTEGLDAGAFRFLAGGINYVFKSLDLIPDGIDDIGYLDDAFIIRLAAKAALESGKGAIDDDSFSKIQKLAGDSDLVEEFLGESIFKRLDNYARNLAKGAARGRTVDEIAERSGAFEEFSKEASDFISEYSAPGFSRDEKNLIKLKAFLEAKLPG